MYSVKIENEEARECFFKLVEQLTGLKKLMGSIASELLTQTERNFTQEGNPKWPMLATATQRARARKGHGATSPILKGRNPNLVRNFILEFNDHYAQIKNPTTYAAIHQFGGIAGKGHKTRIPARPFLPIEADKKTLTPPMRKAVKNLLKAHLKQALNQ